MTWQNVIESRVERFGRLLAAGEPVAVTVSLVALHAGLPVERLLSPARPRPVVMARHVAFALARQHSAMSLAEIGAVFGMDHTSVPNGIARAPFWIGRYPEVAACARAAGAALLEELDAARVSRGTPDRCPGQAAEARACGVSS